jgi:hypothetical protein
MMLLHSHSISSIVINNSNDGQKKKTTKTHPLTAPPYATANNTPPNIPHTAQAVVTTASTSYPAQAGATQSRMIIVRWDGPILTISVVWRRRIMMRQIRICSRLLRRGWRSIIGSIMGVWLGVVISSSSNSNMGLRRGMDRDLGMERRHRADSITINLKGRVIMGKGDNSSSISNSSNTTMAHHPREAVVPLALKHTTKMSTGVSRSFIVVHTGKNHQRANLQRIVL